MFRKPIQAGDEAEGTVVEKEISEAGRLLESLRSKVSELGKNNVKITSLQKQIKEYQLYLEKDISADLSTANTDLKLLEENNSSLLLHT